MLQLRFSNTRTSFGLSLDNLDLVSVQECAVALRQNTSAHTLTLLSNCRLPPITKEANWVLICNEISNHSVLAEVELFYGGAFHSNTFLGAIGRSLSIERVSLEHTVVNVNSLSTFFTTTKSVTTLELDYLEFEGTLNPGEAARIFWTPLLQTQALKSYCVLDLIHITKQPSLAVLPDMRESGSLSLVCVRRTSRWQEQKQFRSR